MRTLKVLPAATLACAVLIAACDTTPVRRTTAPESTSPMAVGSGTVFHATFAAAPCPDDVTANVVVAVSCGYLSVLEDRAKPTGRTIELFVSRFDPPGGTTTPDPLITLADLADGPDYGGQAPSGQRTHRVLYLLDPRGIAHSKPSLDCPEVVAVGPVLAGFRLRDPARRAVLLAAVRACRDRLVGQGIDLGVYDLAAEASDMEDLRITLGIDKWNINTNGSANRVGFEVARQYPDGLRSIVVDSPNLPSPDFLTIGPAMLDLAISRLVSVCAAEPACARAFPDLDAMIRNAIARLDAEPVTVAVTGTVDAVRLGHPISVVVDGAALVRVIRFGLATGGGGGAARALTTIRDALDGKLTGSDGLVGALSSDTGDCLGLLPICERTNVGALYSILCRDYVARIDGTRLTASLDGRAAYADVFAPSPLLAPCTAWGVAPAEAASSGSLTGSVPILALRGTFDPFSATTSDVMTAAAGASNAYVLDVPNQSYNVLGHNECTLLIRNAWVDAPTTEPADTSCLAALPPFDFTR